MNKAKCSAAGLCIGVLLVGGLNAQDPVSIGLENEAQQESSSHQKMKWLDSIKFCEEIWELEPWPTRGDLTRRQWDDYVELAARLQRLLPADLDAVIIAYMVYGNSKFLDTEASDSRMRLYRYWRWQTRVLILLRLIYEVPSAPLEDPNMLKLMAEDGVWLNGLMSIAAEDAGKAEARFQSSPLLFKEDGAPAIGVNLENRVAPGGGNPYHAYQPHIEARYFRSRFPLRKLR